MTERDTKAAPSAEQAPTESRTDEQLIAWLEQKYRRHMELCDHLAAERLKELICERDAARKEAFDLAHDLEKSIANHSADIMRWHASLRSSDRATERNEALQAALEFAQHALKKRADKWGSVNNATRRDEALQCRDAIESAINSLRMPGVSLPSAIRPPDGWIPVTERLPDDDTTVMVAIEGGSEPVWLGFLDGEVWTGVDAGPFEGTVTHWQPIPEAPR